MYPMVFFKSTFFSKLSTTYFTLMGFQSRMYRIVFFQSYQCFEGFPAGIARVRSDRRVRQQMIVQIAFLNKTFAAMFAREVSDAHVDAFVGSQIWFRTEFLVTLIALVAVFYFSGQMRTNVTLKQNNQIRLQY